MKKAIGEREILGDGNFLRLVREEGWERVESRASGAAAILGVTDEGELLFVEQYRSPVKGKVVELPAGIVGDHEAEPGEESIKAARRELLEETGFEAGEIRFLGSGPSSAGLAAEIIEFFFASKLVKRHGGGGVGQENIVVHVVAWAEAWDWLARKRAAGDMIDLRIYAAFEVAEREGLLER